MSRLRTRRKTENSSSDILTDMKAYKVLPLKRKENLIYVLNLLQCKIEHCDECWNWRGTTKSKGYGVTIIPGLSEFGLYLAHRLFYMLLRPDEDIRFSQLDHQCSNPACVNPDHLVPLPPREHSQLTQHRELIRKIRSRAPDPVYQAALDEQMQLWFDCFQLGQI